MRETRSKACARQCRTSILEKTDGILFGVPHNSDEGAYVKRFRYAAFLVSAALLVGCSTKIAMRVLKPAHLDVPPFERIAVLDFDFTGSWDFWYDNKELTFEDLAKEVIGQVFGVNREARSRPDPKRAFAGSEASSKVTTGLVSNGHYQVIERTQLNRVLQEHSLAMSGLIDETKAVEIGKLLGVEALMLGSASYSVSDAGEWFSYKDKIKKRVVGDSGEVTTVTEEITRKAYRAKRSVSLDMVYRIVEVESGQIVAAQNFRRHRTLTSEKPRPVEAFENLPDWRPAVSGMVSGIAGNIVVQIAPHYVYQTRKILKGKSRAMKSAMELAKRGMFQDACAIWEEAARNTSPDHRKDREAALYNLGVYMETIDELEKAESYFNRCFKLTGKTKYLDDRSRVRRRREELARLKDQQAL